MNAAFDIASASVPSRERIVTLSAAADGCSVCGSRMWPYVRPSDSRKLEESADVDTDVSPVSTTPITRPRASGSLMPTVHRALAGRRAEQILVAAGIDEAAQPAAPEHAGGDLDGESLRNATQVELDARTSESNRAVLGIEHARADSRRAAAPRRARRPSARAASCRESPTAARAVRP